MKLIRAGLLLVAAVLALLLASQNRAEVPKNVVENQTPYIDKELWGDLVSQDVNSQPIHFFSGLSKLPHDGYMSDDMEFMIPIEDLNRAFQCFSRFYDESRLVLQKNNLRLEYHIAEPGLYVNGEFTSGEKSVTCRDGQYYVPVSEIADYFQCEYQWDFNRRELVIYDLWTDNIVPPAFCLKDEGCQTTVRNQGNLGTCWAVAAISAMETTLLPRERFNFSADHMSIRNSFSVSQKYGGEYTMAMAYLAAWQGPVTEEMDPYGDHESPEGLKPVKHVQEIRLIKNKDLQKIKKAVFLYGSVETAIYTSLRNSTSRSPYYNRKEASYAYTGAELPNHDITIIGWDDNYSKDNFTMKVEGNGAFICQNSWGTGFGNEGIFYVSYYDSNIGSQSVVYSRIDSVENYECIYQTDLCGWAGQLGYNQEQAYFANVFHIAEDELVRAVGFYATDSDTTYEISYVENFTDAASFGNRHVVQSGNFENAGFYTVDLQENILVQAGSNFAIVIRISTPGSVHPIAVEYQSDVKTKEAVLDDGEGYISLNGAKWSDTEEELNCNVCMKLYTDRKKNGE